MFTGLVKELGVVTRLQKNNEGSKITIRAPKLISQIEVDDSVSVNGACQTVIGYSDSEFIVQAVHTTLTKTTLGQMRLGQSVNLELAMRLGDRLGGHLVQGHINGFGRAIRINNLGKNYLLQFEIPENLISYVVKEGSITLDGVSLTVNELNGCLGSVSIIPHTWENTIFKALSVGDSLNIEVDILAKYVESLLHKGSHSLKNVEKTTKSKITQQFLADNGF